MKWRRGGDYYLITEDGRFIISKSSVRGQVCYMAVRAGQRGDASDILHVERDIDPADDGARLAALDRCKAACAESARV